MRDISGVGLVRIDYRQKRSGFDSGDPELDRWVHQDACRTQPGALVKVATDSDRVMGCFRCGAFEVEGEPWSVSSLRWGAVAQVDQRRGSGDRALRAVLISRLGVDRTWHGSGLGSLLLLHALEIAVAVAPRLETKLIVAHAGSPAGVGFGARFGFRSFETQPYWMYLLLQDVSASFATLNNSAGRS